MTPPIPVLDVDLLIEHDGHRLKLRGSERRFVANVPTLLSLLHFSRIFWQYRKRVAEEYSLEVQWRQLRIPVKSGTGSQRP